MPRFKCRVAGESGEVELRSLAAASVDDCRRAFESEGKLILSIRREWKGLRKTDFDRKVAYKDIILFNQEFLTLIKAGYPIFRSLEAIAGRTKNLVLKDILSRAAEDIRRGKFLSEAFKPYEKHFSAVYTASLMAGERSGNLPSTLSRYIDYIKTISQTRDRIRSALAYPTLVIVFGLILLSVLMAFVLPRFADFYTSFEAQMPLVTRLVMKCSGFLNRYFYLFLGLAAILAFLYHRAAEVESFKIKVDRRKLRLPIGGGVWLESGASYFCRTLGLLLEAGIALVPALDVACQAVPNRYMRERLKLVPDVVRNGDGLTEGLTRSEVFPPVALDMVRIGENSANLSGMLSDVSDFFDERVRGKIDTIVSLVEPAVIILTGIMVAVMLLSVYLPIFNIIRITR